MEFPARDAGAALVRGESCLVRDHARERRCALAAFRPVTRDFVFRHHPRTCKDLSTRFGGEQPSVRVLDAASALGVAPNTVSTLVGRLTAAGLLERHVDPEDARAARLFLTPAARRRFADWRDRRQGVIGEAFRSLSQKERLALAAAIPTLRRLVDHLEAE
jgi:DNA-binding MarR family transcriptional regulator